jgi:hypothetical protein
MFFSKYFRYVNLDMRNIYHKSLIFYLQQNVTSFFIVLFCTYQFLPRVTGILYRSTGRKIGEPELLEAVRLTIINNMIQYHPEASSQLALGATFGPEPPTELVDVDIATHIDIYDDGPDRSLLVVETADRPGLLVDLVKIIDDINITVQSGEFDTEGLLAKAKFHVSYRGKPLIKALQQVKLIIPLYFRCAI